MHSDPGHGWRNIRIAHSPTFKNAKIGAPWNRAGGPLSFVGVFVARKANHRGLPICSKRGSGARTRTSRASLMQRVALYVCYRSLCLLFSRDYTARKFARSSLALPRSFPFHLRTRSLPLRVGKARIRRTLKPLELLRQSLSQITRRTH